MNFEIEAFVLMLLVARWDDLNWVADLFERKEACPEEKWDAVCVPCEEGDQRCHEKEVRAVKVGRAAMAGRRNVGRLKVIIRGAEIVGARETLASPKRPRAEASVEARHELPSATIARIEVRVMMAVSTKGFVSVLSDTPSCTRVRSLAARLLLVYRHLHFVYACLRWSCREVVTLTMPPDRRSFL